MINQADTAWVLIASAMVMFMTPALAFFYGGLVRKKNILSILMQCMALLSIISLQWILFGYSLAFGPDKWGIIGGLEWAGLRDVGLEPSKVYGTTIPHQLFMIFQMMFAVITPALIIGAFAERVKFAGFALFSVLWSTLIYDPMAHWVWGNGGWLSKLGALDFAGGTVIHINAGIAALVMALYVGKRVNFRSHSAPHNLPFAVLGAGILWFGWFGFNAGSALSVGPITVNAFLVTNTAAAAAGVTWMVLDWIFNRITTVLGIITGIVAGLVAITPASGYVNPMSAIVIGMLASLCGFYFVTKVKKYFGYDDSLDVFGIHGICGIVGALATGIFATKSINPDGADGLLYGNPKLLLVQTITVLVSIAYSAIGTYVILKVVDKIIGIRVDRKDEHIGLDLTQHHEAGYTLVD